MLILSCLFRQHLGLLFCLLDPKEIPSFCVVAHFYYEVCVLPLNG